MDSNGDYLFYHVIKVPDTHYPTLRVDKLSLINTNNLSVKWEIPTPSPSSDVKVDGFIDEDEERDKWMIHPLEQMKRERFAGLYGVVYKPSYIIWADAIAVWCINRQTGDTLWYHHSDSSHSHFFDNASISFTSHLPEDKGRNYKIEAHNHIFAKCGKHGFYWNGHSYMLVILHDDKEAEIVVAKESMIQRGKKKVPGGIETITFPTATVIVDGIIYV